MHSPTLKCNRSANAVYISFFLMPTTSATLTLILKLVVDDYSKFLYNSLTSLNNQWKTQFVKVEWNFTSLSSTSFDDTNIFSTLFCTSRSAMESLAVLTNIETTLGEIPPGSSYPLIALTSSRPSFGPRKAPWKLWW
jgi:hypothetical protein